MTPRDISIVIPTLNEETSVADAIQSVIEAGAAEIIVSDGGSRDLTVDRAMQTASIKLVRSLPGRGVQLNSGFALASRDFVLFLHADCRLAPEALQQLCEHPEVTWGGMEHRIDSPRRIYRWIERGNAARVRYRSLVFGDQAMFVRSDAFRKVGGFANIPLMEDVELSRRLSKIDKPLLLPGPVRISPRRWESKGVVKQTLRNWSIQFSYARGTSPEKLAQRYNAP